MNTDLDTRIRRFFEAVDAGQEPLTLDAIERRPTAGARATAPSTRSGRRRPLLVAVAIALVVVFTLVLTQRRDSPSGVVTQLELPAAGAATDLRQDGPPRVVISPLVELRQQMTARRDVEIFTVESPASSYWRLTSLDVFDGRVWGSRGSFDKASGSLESDLPGSTDVTLITQTFDIEALGAIWLPAAYEPAEVLASPLDVDVEYEARSGTLIVGRAVAVSDGLTYTLISRVPERDLAAIEAAGNDVPGDIAERYLPLPDDLSPQVAALAASVTEGAATPYQNALALQHFFRDPERFAYALDVSSGHSSDRIEDFLFEVRVGYAEQFASAYVVMARSIGLPARVAVGFTPGEFDPEINAYRVAGSHAHAWPEVWIDGVGWLRFEPTPGRNAPDGTG